MLDWEIGVATYLMAHGAHWIVWRRFPEHRSVPLLAIILFGLPAVQVILNFFSPLNLIYPLVHSCLAANYFVIYPAFQASSPTIHLLRTFRKHDYLSRQALETMGDTPSLLADRIQDLYSGHFINADLQLEPRGKWIARIFLAYRKSLGLPSGDGG